MDHRLYFIFGDLISNIITGILMAVIPMLFVSTGWNMLIAMIVMMILAMILSLFVSLALGILFGAMEVMVPAMLSGMLSGMFSGMWLSMRDVSFIQLVYSGAIIGLVVVCIVWFINTQIRGVQTPGV